MQSFREVLVVGRIYYFFRRYALTGKEVLQILKQRLIKVDGKVKTDTTYPAGFMDVIEIEKTDEHFRLIYDSKGRFVVHRIEKVEAAYKLCQVRKLAVGRGGVPYVTTHDGRTLRYPDPDVKVRECCGAGRGYDGEAFLWEQDESMVVKGQHEAYCMVPWELWICIEGLKGSLMGGT